MLRRSQTYVFLRNGAYVFQQFNPFRQITTTRNYTSDDHNKHDDEIPQHQKPTTLLPGGGLEKLQGGIKEEAYFNTHDMELITKIRDAHGAKLKCENCIGNWAEFQRMLDTNTPAQMRDTGSLSPHKNCNEEAFFLNEHKECLQLMHDKFNSSKYKVNDINLNAQASNLHLKPSEMNRSTSIDIPAQRNDVLETILNANNDASNTNVKLEEQSTKLNLEPNEVNQSAAIEIPEKQNNVSESMLNASNNENNNNEDYEEEQAFLEYEPHIEKKQPENEKESQKSTNNSSALPDSKTK